MLPRGADVYDLENVFNTLGQKKNSFLNLENVVTKLVQFLHDQSKMQSFKPYYISSNRRRDIKMGFSPNCLERLERSLQRN